MRYSLILLLTLLVSSAACLASSAVDDLYWMSGCWASIGADPGSGEQWSAPAAGTILGVSRAVDGSRTLTYEFMVIREEVPGELEFVAKSPGQTEVTFSMTSLSKQAVVFENMQRDFPKRVGYRLETKGNLVKTFEGNFEGTQTSMDFPMAKIRCTVATPNP